MAQSMSKTARASIRPTQTKGGLAISGDIDRIVPLDDGRWAYVRDADGKTQHLRTSSDEIISLLDSLDGEGRVTVELARLAERFPTHGWDAVARRLAEFQAAAQAASEPVE